MHRVILLVLVACGGRDDAEELEKLGREHSAGFDSVRPAVERCAASLSNPYRVDIFLTTQHGVATSVVVRARDTCRKVGNDCTPGGELPAPVTNCIADAVRSAPHNASAQAMHQTITVILGR